jgi:DNA-binding FadR family transcriptional regulator
VSSILEALKHEIRTSLVPGDYLPNERLLAERYGVGRNTVREAMIFLEAYGMVEKTQRGARVTEPDFAFAYAFAAFDNGVDRSIATYRDLVEFRRTLEIGILDRIFDRVSDEDLARLDEIVDRMERSLTAREAAETDFAFHSVLIDVSGNSILRRLYSIMTATMTYYLEIGKTKYGAETVARHREIIAALRDRSRADLEAAVQRHFEYSEAVLNREFVD